MGDLLAQLELSIRRSRPDKVTQEEKLLLNSLKSVAVRSFTVAATISSSLMWIGTRRRSYAQRFNASVASGLVAGMLTFNRSLDTHVEEILKLEGTELQMRLASIIMVQHQQNPNPSRINLVKKYYYPEEVLDDTKPEPFLRWRYRNYYFERSANQTGEEIKDEIHNVERDERKTSTQSTRSIAGGDVTEDPLSIMFGDEDGKDVAALSGANMSRRRLRKKARRHRSRHCEVATDEAKN